MALQDKENKANLAKARISILGEEYTLRGEGGEEYITRLGCLVDERMRQIVTAYPDLPRHKAAILAAIYLADEVEKLTREKNELEQLLAELD